MLPHFWVKSAKSHFISYLYSIEHFFVPMQPLLYSSINSKLRKRMRDALRAVVGCSEKFISAQPLVCMFRTPTNWTRERVSISSRYNQESFPFLALSPFTSGTSEIQQTIFKRWSWFDVNEPAFPNNWFSNFCKIFSQATCGQIYELVLKNKLRTLNLMNGYFYRKTQMAPFCKHEDFNWPIWNGGPSVTPLTVVNSH